MKEQAEVVVIRDWPVLVRVGPSSGRSRTACPPDDLGRLPGRIDVARVRTLREQEETDPGRQLMRRFMVRGHWRRASRTWKDQRLRWSEPYWKGPTLGDVIEREYRLRP